MCVALKLLSILNQYFQQDEGNKGNRMKILLLPLSLPSEWSVAKKERKVAYSKIAGGGGRDYGGKWKEGRGRGRGRGMNVERREREGNDGGKDGPGQQRGEGTKSVQKRNYQSFSGKSEVCH